MSIGVAIIGSGIFVQEEHLPAVENNPHLTLKAIYSRSLKSAQSLKISTPNVALFSDDSGVGNTYHDLLLRPDIHAVVIALPILVQPEFIEAALTAGKHVLSEKPIAKDIARAEKLIHYYKNLKTSESATTAKPTWGVAEQFRFMTSFLYARKQVEGLGRILGFRTRMFALVKPGSKYFETPWRKHPGYQGGFLLDGGVHFVAGTRLLLGEEAKPVSVSAVTSLLRDYLPPVDTLDAVWKCKAGIGGTFCASFGTTFEGGGEYQVACEDGVVTVGREKVTVKRVGGESEETLFKEEGSGVRLEIEAWAESLVNGKQDPGQNPEEALKDLELLESMLTSGDNGGSAVPLKYV